MEIASDMQKTETKVAQKENLKTTTASAEKPVVVASKEEAKPAAAEVKKTQEVKAKETVASQKQTTQKTGLIWKKLKSEAALSKEDRSFLLNYFKRYYPADYAEALIAQY